MLALIATSFVSSTAPQPHMLAIRFVRSFPATEVLIAPGWSSLRQESIRVTGWAMQAARGQVEMSGMLC